MEKIKDFYSSNLPWKILSIVLGFLIWLVGMNINNPVITQVVTVDLELLNENYIEEQGLTLLNYNDLSSTKVNVNIKGSRTDIEALKNNPDEIYAYIDFKPSNVTNSDNVGVDLELMIDVDSDFDEISILNFSPRTVKLQFDNVITEQKEIVVNQIGLEENRYITEQTPNVTPRTVSITGPETIINTISEVNIGVDVSEATESFTSEQSIKVFDVNGREITNKLELSSQNASVYIDVNQGSTVKVLEPTLVGTPNENIEIVSISYEPNAVQVVGDEANIENLEYIMIDPIDISDIEETTEYTFDVRQILAQNNLEVDEDATYIIKTTVEVKQLDTVKFRYYIDDILIQGMKDNITGPSYIDITLYGDRDIIADLSKEDIDLSLDLRNIREGMNTVVVNANLPNGIDFLNGELPTVEFYYGIEDVEGGVQDAEDVFGETNEEIED